MGKLQDSLKGASLMTPLDQLKNTLAEVDSCVAALARCYEFANAAALASSAIPPSPLHAAQSSALRTASAIADARRSLNGHAADLRYAINRLTEGRA